VGDGALDVGLQLRVCCGPVLNGLAEEESGGAEVGGDGLLQLVQQLVEAADVGCEVYDGGLHGLVDCDALPGSGDLGEAIYDPVCLLLAEARGVCLEDDVGRPDGSHDLGEVLPEEVVAGPADISYGLDVAEALVVGFEGQVDEVEDLVGLVESFSSLVSEAGELPVLVYGGFEFGALEAEEPGGLLVLVEDDLESCLAVDAAFELGYEEGEVEVHTLVDRVYTLLDEAVVLDIDVVLCGLEDGLEACCHGGEVGVGDEAFADELVLSEPSVVGVHSLVVGAGRRRRRLAESLCLGGSEASEEEPPQSWNKAGPGVTRHHRSLGLMRAVLSTVTPGLSFRFLQGSLKGSTSMHNDAFGGWFSGKNLSSFLF